jgi:hypothetical protein
MGEGRRGRCKISNIIGENEEREFYLHRGWRKRGRGGKGVGGGKTGRRGVEEHKINNVKGVYGTFYE